MHRAPLQNRLARIEDLDALTALMDLAIGELLKPYLDATQIASSRTIMGLDTQLIRDGTYFVVEEDGRLAGSGGWSMAATPRPGGMQRCWIRRARRPGCAR